MRKLLHICTFVLLTLPLLTSAELKVSPTNGELVLSLNDSRLTIVTQDDLSDAQLNLCTETKRTILNLGKPYVFEDNYIITLPENIRVINGTYYLCTNDGKRSNAFALDTQEKQRFVNFSQITTKGYNKTVTPGGWVRMTWRQDNVTAVNISFCSADGKQTIYSIKEGLRFSSQDRNGTYQWMDIPKDLVEEDGLYAICLEGYYDNEKVAQDVALFETSGFKAPEVMEVEKPTEPEKVITPAPTTAEGTYIPPQTRYRYLGTRSRTAYRPGTVKQQTTSPVYKRYLKQWNARTQTGVGMYNYRGSRFNRFDPYYRPGQ